jgi:hypothetical protein
MSLRTALLFLVASLPTLALAHGGGHGHDASGAAPTLHVGKAYESCYFDLHPELTQRQLRTFTAEAGEVVRFQQLGAARALGAGTWSFDIGQVSTPINDAKGAWNNTFSHPEADHYLGDVQNIPRLGLRYGLNGWVDLGLWGTLNPTSNYGFVGVDAKLTLLEDEIAAVPVHVAVRPSLTTVLGPKEIWFGNAAVDLTAGLTVAGLSPYVGVGGTLGAAVERSSDVDLDPALTVMPVAVTGITYQLWHVHVAAEATWSTVQTYGVVLRARSQYLSRPSAQAGTTASRTSRTLRVSDSTVSGFCR